jgi:pyruvate/2-oxoglutarate/acetoin dehydrogenase E1 component/TPP-dependent pyruvate/acetoin dehydrogenase alpha subunit
MFALDLCSIEDFFAQLYADAENDPFSGGRQMNNHFATPLINTNNQPTIHKELYNVSSDISSTGGQMARALGLALASKKYKESEALREGTPYSKNGQEVTFCTIGDASTSEGVFWETMNAAAVMKVPLAVSVWDDGYGISVPKKYQTTKESISEALSGFELDEEGNGMYIFKEKGWNYAGLVNIYQNGIDQVRQNHLPALFHIEEVTQPQGHSTSGSHERYKSKERLQWEREHDCILIMGKWMIEENIATQEELDNIRLEAKREVKEARNRAWKRFNEGATDVFEQLKQIYSKVQPTEGTEPLRKALGRMLNPFLAELTQNAKRLLYQVMGQQVEVEAELKALLSSIYAKAEEDYHDNLYSHSEHSALNVPVVAPQYSAKSATKNGYEVLNTFFDLSFERDPSLFAFGEDVGHIGDVNQGFAGLQKKFGIERIFDTGIREWTIMGQAIGMAMRGLRPIAEIQYLDYLVYSLPALTDDLATLRYRSDGLQQAPAIIRTRGHRLEGIWHAGSPMGMLLHSLRGMYILVPRNMVQAVGMYNTMIQSDDPALIIECLNGYRLKEKMPDNIGKYTVPLGVPDVLQEGTDVTLVTYGSCVRIAEEGIALLEKQGISVELIDVQTLLPFDLEHQIVESLKKTNRLVIMDEDVPGGASAYILQEVLEKQGGYYYLDSAPVTLTAKAHRPPYGSDGDYFSKPNPEDVFESVYRLMSEVEPQRFPGSL